MSSKRVIDLRGGRAARPASTPRASQRESERRLPLRVRRRRTRFIVGGVLLLLVGALAYGLHVLSYQPRFIVQTISVEGTQRVPPEIVSDYVSEQLDDGRFHFFARRNILLYPKAALARSIAANFPRIRSARVSLMDMFSTKLIVTVEERAPFAKWCATLTEEGAPCYWMDDQGYVYAEAGVDERGANNYVFAKGLSGGGEQPIGRIFAPTHVPGLMAMLRYLEQARFSPTSISIENEQDFYVYLRDGFYIKASYGQDAAQLARNLELILASDALRGKAMNLEYIDLRFGNRVYYKLKGEVEVSAP